MSDVINSTAFSEVLEILKYIPIIDYEKIPLDIIEVMEDNSNKDIIIDYNPKISLLEQNISDEAKTIIAIFFRDYWATEKQKEKILAKEKYDNEIEEIEKQKEYNIDFFKNRENKNIHTEQRENITQLTVYKEANLLKRIITKIKKIFRLM